MLHIISIVSMKVVVSRTLQNIDVVQLKPLQAGFHGVKDVLCFYQNGDKIVGETNRNSLCD